MPSRGPSFLLGQGRRRLCGEMKNRGMEAGVEGILQRSSLAVVSVPAAHTRISFAAEWHRLRHLYLTNVPLVT